MTQISLARPDYTNNIYRLLDAEMNYLHRNLLWNMRMHIEFVSFENIRFGNPGTNINLFVAIKFEI